MNNQASLTILAQRTWQALAGVITLVFVTHYLTPKEQGYYYTLVSIAAMHMFLDMGLSTILVQFAAKAFIGLSWGNKGQVNGGERLLFLALTRWSLRWYGVASVILLLAYPAGLLFISGGQLEIMGELRGPWILLVFATAANFWFLPALALTEGSGCVAEVYKVRLIQGIVGSSILWAGMQMGWGLYIVAVMPASGAIVAAAWLLLWRSKTLQQTYREKNVEINWKTRIWPLQWRSSASWLSGYVLVLMHVPLLFHSQGAVVAGQMGVTMTVANMLSILASSWMSASVPNMTQAVASRDWKKLDLIFAKAFRTSTIAFILAASFFLMTRVALDNTPYGDRFLSLNQTIGLVFAIGLYHLAGLFAVYLRSHLQEPLLYPSMIGALLTAVAAILIAPKWGAGGIVLVLIAVNSIVFLPIAFWMWMHYRKKWHVTNTSDHGK